MDWLRRHRLIAIAIILGIGMMGADALIQLVSYRHGDWLAELSGLQALELGMLISFLVLPILFGLYAHSLLQRAQLAAGTVRHSEQFLNALMENVPQIICIKDAGTMHYVHVNRSAEILLDCSRDQLIGASDRDIPPIEQADALFQQGGELVEDENTAEFREVELITPLEGKRQFRTRITPVFDEHDRRTYLLCVAEDITGRRQAEEKLNLTAAVFESTDQGVIIIDRSHCIVSVNPAFITLTGYTLDEVKGKNLLFLKSSRHNEAFYDNIWLSLEKKGFWKGDIWSRRKNGEIYPSWHTISPIYNTNTGKLTHYVSIFSDITPIKRQQANVDLLAYHDPLTGLPNRLLLTERLEHALSVLARLNTQVALLFFDLDGFKDINDTLGHTVGDSLLQAVAGRMQSVLRDGDTVARFGGDEFVILTESCESRAGIERVAEKIIEEVSQPVQVDGQEIVVQTSVGIAIGPADGTDSQTLIQSADKAMYRAKMYKGSHYCFYNESRETEVANST
jgi:diguanylate cyclase (GGDEF)-like protein/PAS domain S-box-containing protein